MKRGTSFLKIALCLISLLLSINLIFVSSMPVYVKPLSINGSLNPNTAYNYVFNWTTDSSCTQVIFSNSTILITGEDGVGFINLTIPTNIGSVPNYLCEYRNGTLRQVHVLSSQIFNKIYVQEINTTGNITAQWFKGFINASNILNAPWSTSDGSNSSWNQLYANTLYHSITSQLGNTTLQIFSAVDNGTFLKIAQWNATNSSYLLIDKFNTTNSTYNAYNSTGLIANWSEIISSTDWNASGLIRDWNISGWIRNQTLAETNWNSSGLIRSWNIADWNSSGLIRDWSSASETDPLWTANITNYFTKAQWNATNTSYLRTDQWNATNTSYLMVDRFNTTNASYLTQWNTSIMKIWQWNSTNSSYLMVDRFNVTNTSYALNQTLTNIWSDIINVNYNSTGLIKDWNVSGWIRNQTLAETNWNASGLIRDWSGASETDPLWTANITNYFTKAQWNVTNTSYLRTDQWNATNSSYLTQWNTSIMKIWQWNATNNSYLMVDRFNVTNTSYALNQTLTNIWSDIINVNYNSTGFIRDWAYINTWTANITNYFTKAQWNATNSSYLMIDRFNVTNTTYRTSINGTFTQNTNMTTMNITFSGGGNITSNLTCISIWGPTSKLEIC